MLRIANLFLTIVFVALAITWACVRQTGEVPLEVSSHAPGTEIGVASTKAAPNEHGRESTPVRSVPQGTSFARSATKEEMRIEALNNSPEARRLRLARTKIANFAAYGRLLASLGLDLAQQRLLLDLITARQSIREDVGAVINQQLIEGKMKGLRKGELRTTIRDAVAQAEQDVGAQMQGLLGNDKLQALRQYDEKLPSNLLVNQLQQLCVMSGEPLNDQKAAELSEILSANPVIPADHKAIALPVAYREVAQIRATNVNLAVLAKNAWLADLSGMLTVNYPLSESARMRAAQLLSPQQQNVLFALREKQVADRTIANRLGEN